MLLFGRHWQKNEALLLMFAAVPRDDLRTRKFPFYLVRASISDVPNVWVNTTLTCRVIKGCQLPINLESAGLNNLKIYPLKVASRYQVVSNKYILLMVPVEETWQKSQGSACALQYITVHIIIIFTILILIYTTSGALFFNFKPSI